VEGLSDDRQRQLLMRGQRWIAPNRKKVFVHRYYRSTLQTVCPQATFLIAPEFAD
jgi:hypothetical protein